jgi:rhodanese-related sulfurtransferase
MKKIYSLLAALALALPAFAGTDFPDISIDDVKTAIKDKAAVILDVNGTESWKEGHVPGALDYAAIKDKLSDSLPKDKNALIIAYCGNPHCHAYARAAAAAKELGYTNIKHMSAGIAGWKDAGAPLEKVESK